MNSMKGMKAYMRKIDPVLRSVTNGGWGNGYVLIGQDHLLHGADSAEIDDALPPEIPHKGVTFTCILTKNFFNDLKSGVHMVIGDGLSKEDLGKYIIGFDTAHFGDGEVFKDRKAVAAETKKFYDSLNQEKFNINKPSLTKL